MKLVRQQNGTRCAQMVRNAPKRQFRDKWVDRVRSLRKILTQLRGTNFCTSSARFPPRFVRQPNGPECTQIVRNTPKHQFRVHWGGLGAIVAKILTRLRGRNFCTSSARFAPRFVRQPNGPRCTQNSSKRSKTSVLVKWGGSGAFVAKN